MLGPVSKLYGWVGVFAMFTGAAIIACFPTIPYLLKEIKTYCRHKAKERAKLFDNSSAPFTDYSDE
jgi:sugar phosphate permease